MRRKRCVWGFSVRVMLPGRCWPVETRTHVWQKPVLVSYTTLGIIEPLDPVKPSLRKAPRARCAAGESTSNSLAASPHASPNAAAMSFAASAVLRRAALNAFRLNSFRAAPHAAPQRTLATAPKKPAAELTFKEAWLSDPATYPIVVIISSTSQRP